MIIPNRWAGILWKIKMICPDAVLYGGALRDLDNGRPIKDLDITFSVKNEADLQDRLDKIEEITQWSKKNINIIPAYREWMKEVQGTADYVTKDNITINLVGLNVEVDAVSAARRCDFGTSMISWDGEKIYIAEEYKKDKENKTFTLYNRDAGQEERSVRRWNKLKEKYPDWVMKK